MQCLEMDDYEKSARKPTHFSRWMNCQIFLNSYKYMKIIKKSFIYFAIL